MKVLFGLLFCFTLMACAQTQKAAPDSRFDAELTGYSYPRAVRYFEFTAQNQKLKMAYVLADPAKPNGKNVLLLHGKNFSAAYWEPTIRLLSERGFRVIAPDQIGFGKSSKPAQFQFSFHELARETNELLKTLGIEKTTVIGHSMGGMLATRFALMFPSRVEKLVLVNPLGLEDWKTASDFQSIDEVYAKELKATPESIRNYQSAAYFDGKWKPEYDFLVEYQSGWSQSPDYPRVAWNAALTREMIFSQPVIYEFGLIKTPTLLVIGQRDRTSVFKENILATHKFGDYPALGRKTVKAIYGAKLVEIKGAGHLPQIETFDEYSKALTDFL